jgi:hypothetical protein
MRTLRKDQRVRVLKDADGNEVNAVGTVGRVRTDGSAWIKVDGRPAGSPIIAYPEDCQPPDGATRAERPRPTLETFGQDHWSTFGYIETRIVDHRGVPDLRHMRCDKDRHPFKAHVEGPTPPTRLRDGTELPDHDDWDCLDDLVLAGLLESTGTAVNPTFKLTDEGHRIAALLRKHKGSGGSFSTFAP